MLDIKPLLCYFFLSFHIVFFLKRGDIPVKWHKPEELEEVWKEMLEG